MQVIKARAFNKIDEYLNLCTAEDFESNQLAQIQLDRFIEQHFSSDFHPSNLGCQNMALDRRDQNLYGSFNELLNAYNDMHHN